MKPIKTPIKSSDPQRRRFAVDRRTLLMSLVGGATGIGGTAALMLRSAPAANESRKVMLYKNPSCECCEGYANYLRDNGFEVSVVPTHDLTLLSQKYAIPTGSEPCHISLVGGYVVGGHIPVEVVNRLLAEEPTITGINLPGMPAGTPGMGGKKTAPFTIYEIANGPLKVYAVV